MAFVEGRTLEADNSPKHENLFQEIVVLKYMYKLHNLALFLCMHHFAAQRSLRGTLLIQENSGES